MTDAEMIAWIDGASYYELLEKWRFGVTGDRFFQGEVGKHFSAVMTKKRDALEPGEASRISKAIGWR